MKRIDNADYETAPGETATVVIQATKVAELVTLAIDGNDVPASSANPLTFRFTVTKPANGTHFGILTFAFPNDAPADAKFAYNVSGSKGGSFPGPTVVKESNLRRGINFQVVGA